MGLLLLAAPRAMQAQFEYTNADGVSLTITGYDGPGGAVTIPASINGLTVTDIGTNAFYDLSNLTSITIPGSATTIGDYAFDLCLVSLALISVATLPPPIRPCSPMTTTRQPIIWLAPPAGVLLMAAFLPHCGIRLPHPATPMFPCKPINLGSALLARRILSLWWKPPPTWPILHGFHYPPTRSPMVPSFSAIPRGRNFPAASTASSGLNSAVGAVARRDSPQSGPLLCCSVAVEP
jgi:hypothetical protein